MIARRTLLSAFALAAVLRPALAPGATGLAGRWTGVWTKAGDDLAVEVAFANAGGTWSGVFESDALQVTAIPFNEVSLSGDRVRILLKGDATTSVFDGVLAGDAITGGFVDGDVHGAFRLARDTRPDHPVRTEDVVFHNGEVSLAGTLVLPAAPGRHPAIVFLHGSGDEARFANRYMAQRFAAAGFAALIYDKRGVGQSTGDWRKGGFEELADDAEAGIRLLRARPEVDPARIGVCGHSQGGRVAPMVANRDGRLAFVIGSAAGGVSPAEMEVYSVSNNIGADRLAPAEAAQAKAYVRELVAVAYQGKDRAGLDAMAARLKDRPWYFDPPPPGDSYWSYSARTAGYDPVAEWRRVRAPVLLIYGEKDERVPPEISARVIRATLTAAGNSDVTVRIVPGVDHTFRLAGVPGGWTKRAPAYADTLVGWARSKVG